jgi:pilus assembly protein FimV
VVGKKEKYLVAAQKFIERGQLDKALAEFARVVEDDPKDTRTWLKMAELHAKRGANSEATEIYLRTGDLYAEQGFAQKAVAVYKNVLKLSPGTVSAHLKLGALFKQLGLLQDAVQQFELASGALQREQKLVEAVGTLRQAMEIQPDNVVLRVKLAEAASQAGLTDEAVREFGRAADQLKAQGRVDESLRVVERLLFHQPDNLAKARDLAEAYIAKGSPRLALPKLQACLKGDPRDPRTLSLLAKALEQLGQVPKAVSVLKELMRLCEELGRASERDAALLRALTLEPNDRELQAAAARHQLGGRTTVGGEVTPPPLSSSGAATAGGTFDLSGIVRAPAAGTSGRVAEAIGITADSGPGIGISLPAGPDVDRIMAEAEVFVKYALLERAADHLGRVFELDPRHRPAREKLIAVLKRLGRTTDAARQAEILEQQAVPARSRATSISLDGYDEDPTADVATPPPLAPAALVPSGDDEGLSTPAPRSLGTDFDVEIRSGDVIVEEAEFEVSSGAIALATLEVAPDAGGGGEGQPWQNLDVDGAADQVTPPPEMSGRASVPVRDARRSLAPQADDEDGAVAFADDPATVANGSERLAAISAAALAQEDYEDDELDEDLEQVTFFIEQSLTEEARGLLQDLQTRFPGHPRLTAKTQQLHAIDARLGAVMAKSAERGAPLGRSSAATVVRGPAGGPRPEGATPPPRALVEGGDADFATRADLAIAYKEMGLYDAAINELKQVAEDPEREVFALTIMGECYEARGSFTDAVIRYKRALNCDQITPEETLALYYLLGGAFDRLGDVSEALYFYEKVVKRSPRFREVEQKVADLRPRMVKRAR